MMLKTKLLLYRFFSTDFGKLMLNALSFGVKVQNLGPKKEKKCPFLVAITIDAESGYVDKDERRIWQKEKPEAFQGYYFGIRNLLSVFDKHKIRATFFLSTQCFSSEDKERALIGKENKNIIKNKHELG